MMHKDPWLLRPSVGERPFRLYCFSYAGGNGMAWQDWQRSLPAHVELYSLQLPGRGARFHETPLTSFADLIASLGGVMAAQPAKPHAYFGHSLGALVAFELARRQHRLGLAAPQQLILSGCAAPRYRQPTEKLHLLNDRDLTQRLVELNGTPREILEHKELMALLLPIIRADMALVDDYVYRPGAKLPIPLAVFAGNADRFAKGAEISGWAEETAVGFAEHWFEGDHFFIHASRDAVLARLNRLLA
jgi:surfactin synthase thioesterase subunit